MTFGTLRVGVEGAVGRLTLDRPDRLNALSEQMLGELAEAAAWFEDRNEVRSVVVHGSGRAFSAGYDISESAGSDGARLGLAMADAIQGMAAVTIAALHGFVVGGGVVLAAACDMRIAAAGTTFFIPEVDMGIPLAWGGIPLLVREIGPARTKDLVLTCRRFDASEAAVMGLVNRVVPDGEELSTAVDLAGELAAKAPVAVRRTKRHVNAWAAGREMDQSDAEALLEALADAESQQAFADYVRRFSGG